MTTIQNEGPAGVDRPVPLSEWPDRIDGRLAVLLADSHVIAGFETKPADQIRSFQMRRIRELALHAKRHSQWWRDHLKDFPEAARSSFTQIPVLSREAFRASIEEAGALPVPQHHGAIKKESTSGSSGVPVSFFVNDLVARMNNAHWLHDERRQGRDSALLRAILIGRIPEHTGPHIRVESRLLLNGVTLQRRVAASSIEGHARWLSETAPAYLIIAPMTLAGLLDVYESGAVAPPVIRQIMSFAETVEPELRPRVRSILKASIRDQYSAEETGPIAFQCPNSDDHYHIADTNVLVEILDESGSPSPPGVVGRVVVTGLNNYASPIIRYELNDLAAWEPDCPCRRQRPALTKLLGRKVFLIRLPSGERKAFRIMARHWLAIAPFREHRLVQVAEGVLRADLVLGRPMTQGEKEAAIAMLREEISPDLTYVINEVEKIDWAPTYKRQDIVSLV